MPTTAYRIVAAMLLIGSIGASCFRGEGNYCENAPHHNCMDLIDAGPISCMSDQACMSPQVCDVTGTMTCVECTTGKHDACSGATPACIGNTCQKCNAHSQCDVSDVCLPDGECANPTQVAYVEPAPAGMDNAMCSKTSPCATVTKALTTGKLYVKLRGMTDEHVVIDIAGKVTLLADPGAKLTRTSNGPLLEIRGASQVEIYDLEISGASGGSNPGISLQATNMTTLTLTRTTVSNNAGGGIVAMGGTLIISQSTFSNNLDTGISATGTSLTISQSTLSKNQGTGISAMQGTLTVSQSTLSGNSGGGVLVGGMGVTFDITNTFIFRNGNNTDSTFGGLNLQIGALGSNRLAFNTIVDNQATVNSGGVVCSLSSFMGPNNIIARNLLNGSASQQNAQEFGGCGYPTSIIQSDMNGLMFQQADVSPFSYKLSAGSTAIDQALTPVPSIDKDNEGDPRPIGNEKDIGADEFHP